MSTSADATAAPASPGGEEKPAAGEHAAAESSAAPSPTPASTAAPEAQRGEPRAVGASAPATTAQAQAAEEHSLLTNEVKEGVHALKARCDEEKLELRNDLEAMRLVIACEGDLSKMIKRVKLVREFEEKYKIWDVPIVEALDLVQTRMPGGFMGPLGYDREGRLVLYSSLADFYPSRMMKDDKLMQCTLRNFADVFQTSATSLDEVDKGFIILMNCKGLSYKNFSFSFEQEFSWMYQQGYPIRLRKIILFNANKLTRIFIKMCKVFLTRKMQERIVILNGTEAIQKLISPECLPVEAGIGTLTLEQQRSNLLERTEAFRAFESAFSLPATSA